MAQTCPNCYTCTCTGATLLKASDGKVVCSKCIKLYTNHLIQTSNPKK